MRVNTKDWEGLRPPGQISVIERNWAPTMSCHLEGEHPQSFIQVQICPLLKGKGLILSSALLFLHRNKGSWEEPVCAKG